MKTQSRWCLASAAATLLVLTGCGSGGGDEEEVDVPLGSLWTVPPPPPAHPADGTVLPGVFRDANVAGIDYFAPGLTGTTGPDGRYEVVVGSPIEFRIGSVILGNIDGTTFANPFKLAENSTDDVLESENRARFLQMLDQDGNPENGILISSAVRAMAASWPQVDFLTTDLESELAAIIADASTADGTTHTLPTVVEAEAHLLRTYYCTYSGLYRGTFTGGGADGVFALVVYEDGQAFGLAHDNVERSGTIVGTQFVGGGGILPWAGSYFFISDGSALDAIVFIGPWSEALVFGEVGGLWQDSTAGGELFGARSFGSDVNAAYRISGYEFPLGTALIMSFEIDAADRVTGSVIDLDSDMNGVPVALTGSLTGATLTASSASGAYSLTGSFDKAAAPGTHTLTGTLQDTRKSRSVPVNLSGCRLN